MDAALDNMETACEVERSMSKSQCQMKSEAAYLEPELSRTGSSDYVGKDSELTSRRLQVESGFWSAISTGWLQSGFCVLKFLTPFRALQYRRRRMYPIEWWICFLQVAAIVTWTIMMLRINESDETEVPTTLQAVIIAQWMHSQSVLAMILVTVRRRAPSTPHPPHTHSL